MPDSERQYPPGPYRSGSKESREYRDGWAYGEYVWRHRRQETYTYDQGLQDGPYRRGYRDGVNHAWERERKARTLDPSVVRQRREEAAAERARRARDAGDGW